MLSPIPLPVNFSLIAGGCITVERQAGDTQAGNARAGTRLCLSPRGQLAVRRGDATLWSTDTAPQDCDLGRSWLDSCHLTFQGDGNLVLYRGRPDAAAAYWNTATGGRATRMVLAATAPYLTMQDAGGAVLWSSDRSR